MFACTKAPLAYEEAEFAVPNEPLAYELAELAALRTQVSTALLAAAKAALA